MSSADMAYLHGYQEGIGSANEVVTSIARDMTMMRVRLYTMTGIAAILILILGTITVRRLCHA